MKEFPLKLNNTNIHKFKTYKFNRDLCRLRQKIIDCMYSENYDEYALKGFSLIDENYNKIDDELVKRICEELHKLKWKTRIAFGGNSLFIYNDEKQLPKILNDCMEF